MKILFVCRGNNCRSQIGEAIYNRLTNSADASSAGTQTVGAGETLEEFNERPDVTSFTVEAMHDAGYDLRSKRQMQITKDMPSKYDWVISMAAKRYTPKWLQDAPNYVHWNIPDPHGRGYSYTKNAKDKIEDKVRELIRSQH